ncbi:MAG: pimeloyl-ACP methyl ester esterase BioH [Sulfuricaulis sp.]
MTLYYERHGHGPDVVLVHGWALHGGVWLDVVRELSQDFRVTVVDLPGHGRSRDWQPHEFTPAALAAAVQRLLTGPAVWVGWSLGALVALAAAQKNPLAVKQLVLVGATPKFVRSDDWPCAMEPAVLEQFAHDLEHDYAATLRRFLSLQIARGEDHAVLRQLRTELFRYGEPVAAALRAGLQLLQEADCRTRLPAIHTSALVLHGQLDRLAPVAAARYLSGYLPQARLEIIAGAGHAPFLSHPAIFLAKLQYFLHG